MEEVEEVRVLDSGRYIPVVLLGTLSSALSLWGSLCLLYMTRRKFQKSVMHRMIFGLSLADLISSTACLIMPYLVPSVLNLPGARGNFASCTTVGFFFNGFIMVSCCYNFLLSLYYVLTVVKNKKERDFTNMPKVEGVCHILAFLVPLSISTVAAATQSINPSPLANNLCTLYTWPWTCNHDETLECQRSSRQTVGALMITRATLTCVLSALSFLGTCWVWLTVRRTLRRSNSYQFARDRSSQSGDKRLYDVSVQAALYSLVYWNTFFWPMTGLVISIFKTSEEIIRDTNKPGFYALQVLYWSLYPLQGFFNFFVYTRLKVQRWRKAVPEKSLWSIYMNILANKESPPAPRSRRTTQTIPPAVSPEAIAVALAPGSTNHMKDGMTAGNTFPSGVLQPPAVETKNATDMAAQIIPAQPERESRRVSFSEQQQPQQDNSTE